MRVKERVAKAVKNMETIVLVLKAKGGFRYRGLIRLGDTELNELEKTCEKLMRDFGVRLAIAETMLMELPPSAHVNRWDEYLQRIKDYEAEVASIPEERR